ncbi:hypothetical protein ACVR1G_07775 [Streptococcus dentasini]
MKRNSSFTICTILIVISNVLMMTLLNNGEEKLSNLFIMAITLLCFPGFLWAIDNEIVSLIRIESSTLFLIATLSVLRLINRLSPLPDAVGATVAIVAFILITVLLVAGIARWVTKKKE